MISKKAERICNKYGYTRCGECPLHIVCAIPVPDLPGETLEEKTAWWEDRMNEEAEAIE